MPVNTRTRPDAGWVDGSSPTPTEMRDLERKTAESVNGDKGGAYALTGQVTINGPGLAVTAPVRLTGGGSIRARGEKFVIPMLPTPRWPKLGPTHKGRARRIVQGIDAQLGPRPWMWVHHPKLGGLASIALAARLTYGTEVLVPELVLPLRVHDGATLTSLEVNMRVLTPREFAPLAMPKVRVYRASKDPFKSGIEQLLATADGSGFFSPPLATTGAAWYADGTSQVITFVPNQNNVIDVASYQYFVHIVEEQGVKGPGDPFDGYRFVGRTMGCAMRGFSSQTLSGLNGTADWGAEATFDGLRVLITDTDDQIASGVPSNLSEKNGIYTMSANAWPRAAELFDAGDFTPGLLIPVDFGPSYGGTLWQLQSPDNRGKVVIGKSAQGSNSQIVIGHPVARGNLYHSVVPTFSVPDLRFQ